MKWWQRPYCWVKINLLEGKLQRGGYRRLHEDQVADASMRSRLMIHELADAVIRLRTVADEVEGALEEIEREDPDE